MKQNVVLMCLLLMTLSAWQLCLADKLIYQPVNPSFGGNPYNASWLMQQAEAQKPKDKSQSSYYGYESDPLKDFSESMNRQILSRLSSRLIQSAFGESEFEPGHYEIGDYIIDISNNDSGIKILIQDPNTGAETSMEIPYY